jgi:hypothetical protein
MEIAWLPEPERHLLWADILRLLQPAAEYGGIDAYEPGDWVWIIYDGTVLYGAAVTRLLPGDEAELRLAGGSCSMTWMGLLDETVSGWARDGGAHRLTMRGRVGWRRYAKRFGWEALGHDDNNLAMFSKEL